MKLLLGLFVYMVLHGRSAADVQVSYENIMHIFSAKNNNTENAFLSLRTEINSSYQKVQQDIRLELSKLECDKQLSYINCITALLTDENFIDFFLIYEPTCDEAAVTILDMLVQLKSEIPEFYKKFVMNTLKEPTSKRALGVSLRAYKLFADEDVDDIAVSNLFFEGELVTASIDLLEIDKNISEKSILIIQNAIATTEKKVETLNAHFSTRGFTALTSESQLHQVKRLKLLLDKHSEK